MHTSVVARRHTMSVTPFAELKIITALREKASHDELFIFIDQLRRERLSLVWPYKAIITTNVLVVRQFGGHFGGQNVQVSML